MNPAHLLRRPAIRRAAGGQHQEEETTRKAMRTSSLVHQGQPRANSAAGVLAPAASPRRLPTDRSKKPQSREASARGMQGCTREGRKDPPFVFPLLPSLSTEEEKERGRGQGGRLCGRRTVDGETNRPTEKEGQIREGRKEEGLLC
jgi:hypothetical protein